MKPMQPRSPKDGPFCWQTKTALRDIRKAFDSNGNVSSAISIYVALTEIGSDEQSEKFQTTIAHIAEKAGLSPRTAGPLLEGLEEIGLVSIQRNRIPDSKLKAPSTYTILPIGNGCVSTGNNCASIRNERKQASLPRVEESPEDSKKNVVEETKAPSAAATTNFDELLAELTPLYPNNSVRHEYDNCLTWYRENNMGTVTSRRFRKWMKRAEPEVKRPKPRRRGPSIDIDAAMRASIAKGEKENAPRR
jgi:hypothetical protein